MLPSLLHLMLCDTSEVAVHFVSIHALKQFLRELRRYDSEYPLQSESVQGKGLSKMLGTWFRKAPTALQPNSMCQVVASESVHSLARRLALTKVYTLILFLGPSHHSVHSLTFIAIVGKRSYSPAHHSRPQHRTAKAAIHTHESVQHNVTLATLHNCCHDCLFTKALYALGLRTQIAVTNV